MKFGAPWENGRFERVEGEIVIDSENIGNSSVSAKIYPSAVNTKEEKRDSHLKSADFFEVEKYPFVTFQSTKVEKVDDKNYKVAGVLKIREVEKEVELDAVLKDSNQFTAKTSLQVADWKLKYAFEENHKVELNIKVNLLE